MTLQRIGFCCKWLDNPTQTKGVKSTDAAKQYNTGTTTVAWLNRQTKSVAEQKLWQLMQQNIESCYKLVKRVGNLDTQLRMVRLSSDILPVYTESTWKYFWQQPDVRDYCEKAFIKVGNLARERDVRLSFHPGQFCVLASDNLDVVQRSIEEFEYHVQMAKYMGYGVSWHDQGFKINVHISGRAGVGGIRDVFNDLSPEARNLITIENEENKYGLDDILQLADICALVFDLHHHWCREGEYLDVKDPRVNQIVDSWRGQRPVMHYSLSREEIIPNCAIDQLPNFSNLTAAGHKKQKLRAHSDFMWNSAVNRYASNFWPITDLQVESKAKNLASQKLFEDFKQINQIFN